VIVKAYKTAKLERSLGMVAAGVDRQPRTGTRQIVTMAVFDPRAQPTVEMHGGDYAPEENEEITATGEYDQSEQ
jgi:hypothetical protein